MFYTDDFMMDVMKIEKLPDFLYHYTSIETLALILKTRKIRFSRLDKVNDPKEAIASDLNDAATLIFASCFTANKNESIPMWKMYGSDLKGVRIKLPNNPFLGRGKPTIWNKGGASQIFSGKIEIKRKNNGPTLTTSCLTGPNKIYYTDDPSFSNPKCLFFDGHQYITQLHDLGMAKNSSWSYEDEWRFTIQASMTEMILPGNNFNSHPSFDLSKYPIQDTEIYIPLDESSFEEMEVTLGPQASQGHHIIVESLLKNHSPRSILLKSSIQIR